MSNDMSKRFQVVLPDSIYRKLEAWADKEGRPTANLAAFLIEMSIRQEEEKMGQPFDPDESITKEKK